MASEKNKIDRQCEFCKENIHQEAIKCKHCHSKLKRLALSHEGTCPYCKEMILPDAVKCKHCKSMLGDETSPNCNCESESSLNSLPALEMIRSANAARLMQVPNDLPTISTCFVDYLLCRSGPNGEKEGYCEFFHWLCKTLENSGPRTL